MKGAFNEIDLRKIDLNLLLVFAAIMRAGSVSQAATRLYLGPSAVSMALNRLRDFLGDPLFVRCGGGMTATPRALQLWDEIEPALSRIDAALRANAFDPMTAERDFTLGAPDDLEFVLVPRLLARLAETAPNVRLAVQPTDFRSLYDQLDAGAVDLGLSALPDRGAQNAHVTETVLRERFAVLFNPELVDPDAMTDIARFAATPQVMVSIRGDFSGPIDKTLAEHGFARRIVGTVARFATIPHILRQRPVVACAPAAAARHISQTFGLAVRALPFPSPEFDLALAWHRRVDEDAAHKWFQETVRRELADLAHIALMPPSTRSSEPVV